MATSTQNPDGTYTLGAAPYSAGPGTPNAPANTVPYSPGTTSPTGKDVFGNPVNLPPTIGSAYGAAGSRESASDTSLDTTTGVYANQANTPVDEQAIRNATTARLQAEIDATNKVYDQKLAEAKITGANNTGSAVAINARRGLGGSDFGQAALADTATKNDAVYSSIGDERARAINDLTNTGYAQGTAEIAAKTAAKNASAADYINFLATQGERKTSRTQSAASQALASGIDLTDPSSAEVKAIADSYNIDPAALVSSFVSAKNAQGAATKANLVSEPVTSNVYQTGPDGKLTQVQKGTATPDSALKEYQYAVTNDGFTGSLADWNAQKANQKVSDSVTHDPITGALQVVQRAGPGVAGTSGIPTTPNTPVKLPSNSTPVSPATPTVPTKGTVANPFDTLSGSDLAYAQSGLPTQAKFKYPQQIDQAAARIKAVLPNWTPANAAAQYAFFKSPTTQTFIANSNTVLNTLDQIKALSSKVPRGSIQMLNGGQLAIAAGTSDPNAAKLVQLATIAGDEAGKLLGGSGGSDFTTALGISLVNPKYSDATFGATIDQLGGRVRNKVSEYYVQGGQTNPNAPAAAASITKGSMSDSDFVEKALSGNGLNYNTVISQIPTGQKGVIDNQTGQVGSIPPGEFDPSKYTPL